MTEIDQSFESASRLERRKEHTHRRLLESANALFLSKGFESTTVEEVAMMADVAKGTFFNYFESKEMLLATLLSEHLKEALENVPGTGKPVLERIQLLLRKARSVFSPYRQFAPRLFTYNARQSIMTHPPRMVQVLSQLLIEGQAHGEIRQNINVEITAMLIAMHFLQLCIHECVDNCSEAEWTDFLDQGLDIIMRGIIAPAVTT